MDSAACWATLGGKLNTSLSTLSAVCVSILCVKCPVSGVKDFVVFLLLQHKMDMRCNN